jgi:general stress protein YciG
MPAKKSGSKSNSGKNPHAVALGKLGASKGGKARAKSLSKSQRSQIARKGGKSGGRGRSK